MLDTIQKLTYRAKANISNAAVELKERLCDRQELPLAGIHGERLYLTSVSQLEQRAAQLQVLYGQLPTCRNSGDNLLLDAWASASIEGAAVSLPEVKKSLSNPQTRDENMVVNAVRGSYYAYGRPITQKNLRTLWEKATEGVCENTHLDGKPYRSGMVEIGSASRTVHTPATPERLPDLMEQWFRFREQDRSLIGSFAVNSAARATPARTFSHGVTGFQPHRHGAEPQWSEGLSDPSELFLGVVPAGNDFPGLLINIMFRPFEAVIGFL